jgi:transcriptional regulator with XRE-family HTH domain
MDYREQIRERMGELGWNQASLAVASGVNPATLSRFFSGKQELDVPQLGAIAGSMGLKAGDLLEKSETDPMADRLAPLLGRLRPLLLEDQIRAVAALATSLDAMLNWRSAVAIAEKETRPKSGTYNDVNHNSVKPDRPPQPLAYGVGEIVDVDEGMSEERPTNGTRRPDDPRHPTVKKGTR